MLRKICLSVIMTLLACSNPAFAAGFDSLPCNGCSSQAMADTAKQRLLQMPVGSSIYVHSISTGEVANYTLFAERDLIPGQVVHFTEPLAVEQWVQDFVFDLREASVLSSGTMKFDFALSVQSELPTSAFEVVGSTASRNNLADFLGDGWPPPLSR